jgi:YVTN family beta-propeller protein
MRARSSFAVLALLCSVIGPALVLSASGALPTGQTAVYVANADGDTVSVIDPATNVVVATVTVGNEPRNLAGSPDRSSVYVPNRHSDDVSIIDTDTNTVVNTVSDASFDEPYALAFTPDGAEAWVVNKEGGGSTTGSVTIIDTATEAVSDSIDDPCFASPEGIAMNPTLAQAYVVNREGNTVCVVDTASATVIATVATGSDPRSAVVTPDGSAVYVANNGSSDVTRIDTSDNSTTTIATGGSPRNMGMTSDGSTVYVPLQNSEMAVIDTATDNVTGINFTGADQTYGAVVVPGTNMGYVTDEDAEVVFAFDAATNTEITGAGFPIADAGFDTPRAIAAIGEEVIPPPPTSSTTTSTSTSLAPGSATPGAARPATAVARTPTFTG